MGNIFRKVVTTFTKVALVQMFTFEACSLVYFNFLLGFSVPLFLYLVLSSPTKISLKSNIHMNYTVNITFAALKSRE